MSTGNDTPLLIGEVSVDVTVTPRGQEQKLRMGGIAHAARGFWASGQHFAVAAVLPKYLEPSARRYFENFGCKQFFVLGYVTGAPNVTLIFDPTEVSDQEYDTLLRDEKSVVLEENLTPHDFENFRDVLVFPGSFDLKQACKLLAAGAKLHIDVAYDVSDVESLIALGRPIGTILISTSSKLFQKIGNHGIEPLASAFEPLSAEALILKENRGGSRVHIYSPKERFEVPAQLSRTVNSVGVGDVFAATYLSHRRNGVVEAALRATFASAAYAQTTDPDVFKAQVRRDARLSPTQLQGLGGCALPWEIRGSYPIYLAAPDFVASDRGAIEQALSSLAYHNFVVRRPVQENGELPPDADEISLSATYAKDIRLLNECALLFAVPTGKDAGTLVEIGVAISSGIPVVVFDPRGECANTMVIAGSNCYSADLDECLNAVFTLLSKRRSDAGV